MTRSAALLLGSLLWLPLACATLPPAATPSPAGLPQPVAEPGAAAGARRFWLNVRGADLESVVKLVSELTGRNAPLDDGASRASEPAATSPEPSPESPPRAEPPRPPAPVLDLRVVGTAMEEGGRSLALLQVGAETRIVAEKGEIVPGAVLSQVKPDLIWVQRPGRMVEFLLFAPREPPAATPADPRESKPPEASGVDSVIRLAEDRWAVDDREREPFRTDGKHFMTQLRVVPDFSERQPDGFKIFAIRPGSLFWRAGLQNGDVIRRINGRELSEPDQAREAHEALKDARVLTVELLRQGKPLTLTYEFR